MEVTVHTVVKNEDMWVWFAICSVLPFVSKILIFDTGSEDKTVEIIKTINSKKIIFEKKGSVDKKGLVKLRQEQLDRTKTEWFLILDGDEIWPKSQLLRLFDSAEKSPKETVAVFNSVKNCIGDIYHYLPESAGNYKIAGKEGNLNIRLIKKTKKLNIKGEYPLEEFSDERGAIQNQDKNLVYSPAWYLHTSFLKRSSIVKGKVSGSFGKSRYFQTGIELQETELPEVFINSFPKSIPNSLNRRSIYFEFLARLLTPVISLRRKLK